ncbi:NmrA family NAD(P)-binding protein [Variovorax flavidus]|uniref:NmrA family NAD(P)-binding protein n=1 Tax=Variovorax flavidus TaxID=3053501 RepID=UPI0025790FEC|nr:NmrA family NAD(P)-binding protein [Variovorax sp. J2P1-59]
MDSEITVLCVGGSGRYAGMVVPELAKRGVRTRAIVRNEDEAKVARSNGATEVVFADLRDPRSLDSATKGVDGVFHIGPVFASDEAQMGLNMVEAARRGGVRKFVFSSVIQPTNTDLANHASKIPVENALFASGMEYTLLHPANLFQNFAGAWKAIVQTGVYAEPNPVDRRLARVDYRDVAEVAAIALTGDRLAYGSFELCSEGMLTRLEIGKLASDLLRKPVEVREIEFAGWARQAKLPYDARELAMLEKIHAHISEHGMPGNSLTLRAILGRPARTVRQYVEELWRGTTAERTASGSRPGV